MSNVTFVVTMLDLISHVQQWNIGNIKTELFFFEVKE